MLQEGVPGGPELLSFATIYPRVRQHLAEVNFPLPQQRGTGTVEHLALTRNRAYLGAVPDVTYPLSRAQPGADAILRLELDLPETVYGVDAPVTVDTAVLCPTCEGALHAPGSTLQACGTCRNTGLVNGNQCLECRGFGNTIFQPCANCDGDGRIRLTRALTVDIPAGVEDGMRIRLARQGEVGPGGGTAGDLYIEIAELPHDVFSRDNNDLHCQLSVDVTDAILGCVVSLHTLDKQKLSIRIPAGSQPATRLRLRGYGVPHLRADGAGDLYVRLNVVIPANLSPEQQRMIRQFADNRGTTP
ncbi:chaperone protein dnaj [Actinoplanes friuliensis DSM 7358]|uniref:Chaperone protein dnaj n=1 Tax=Actinoplanes friuliensis DSM 7358 TaxID=1246995 RepID=U5W8A3_9ACTN|nr:chaperone protein dnaj [Actinoplanes friuliensis DSM 7358]